MSKEGRPLPADLEIQVRDRVESLVGKKLSQLFSWWKLLLGGLALVGGALAMADRAAQGLVSTVLKERVDEALNKALVEAQTRAADVNELARKLRGETLDSLSAGAKATALIMDVSTRVASAKEELDASQDDYVRAVAALKGIVKPEDFLETETAQKWLKQAIQDTTRSMPVAAVIAWPHNDLPDDNWAFCDGRAVDSSWDSRLKEICRRHYRDRLPDYRGYFLRGVDVQEHGVDRGIKERIPNQRVGSKQESGVALQPPATEPRNIIVELPREGSHWFVPNFGGWAKKADMVARFKGEGLVNAADVMVAAAMRQDSETRPVNIYVHWIIKVK